MRPLGTTSTLSRSLTHRIQFINRLRARQPNLVDLLINAKNYYATNARDKIYAFLGLSQFDVKVNYKTTTVDLYVQFASQYLLRALSNP
jgi:hypothetical protein